MLIEKKEEGGDENEQSGGEPTVRSVLESRIHHSFTVASDELFGLGYMDREQRIALSGLISDMLETFGSSIDAEISERMVSHDDAQLIVSLTKGAGDMAKKRTESTARTTPLPIPTPDWVKQTVDNGVTIGHHDGGDEAGSLIGGGGGKEKDEKMFGGYYATTFEELDAARLVEEGKQVAISAISDFMVLAANVMDFEEDPVKAIEALAQEMVSRLSTEKQKNGHVAGSKQAGVPAASEPDLDRNGFIVWKEADGTYRWLGVYSNKFRDDDRPVKEIISEKAHQQFIGGVNEGEIEYPDLYVWHIPVPVGKSDLLAYDDSGFSVVSGTFSNKSVAEALLITSEDLAMSHGMPAEFIQRDKDDNSVITRYVSTEVSVLPQDVAANKRTTFSVLSKQEDQNMAINSELRGKVVNMIGESATASLEDGLSGMAEDALKNDVDFKDQGEGATAADTSDVAAKTEDQEGDVTTSDADSAQAGVGAAASENAPEETDVGNEAGEAGDESAAEVDPILELKQEIVGLIVQVVKTVEDSNAVLLERITAVETAAAQTKETEIEAEQQTTATVASILASQLSGSQAASVIGNSATQVHGNSGLAKDAPEQEMGEEAQSTGLFFQKWAN